MSQKPGEQDAKNSKPFSSPSDTFARPLDPSAGTPNLFGGTKDTKQLPISMRSIANISANEYTSFLSTEQMTIYIGPKRKKYLAHTGLLQDMVPNFTPGVASLETYLETCDLESFDLFLIWLYRGPSGLPKDNKISVCTDLYILAEKWGSGALQNTMIDTMSRSISTDSEGCLQCCIRELLSIENMKLPGLKQLKAFFLRNIIVAAVKNVVGKGEFFALFCVEKETMAALLWESITVAREISEHCWSISKTLEVKVEKYYVNHSEE